MSQNWNLPQIGMTIPKIFQVIGRLRWRLPSLDRNLREIEVLNLEGLWDCELQEVTCTSCILLDSLIKSQNVEKIKLLYFVVAMEQVGVDDLDCTYMYIH